ncbi:hypothetical protein [Leptospira borgpetersenii]|uniref:hypothetical protein n=1 Tax=Leptospira borgpetersenii TaxID=174 RepID=UPI000773D610|nr:hypothetical protein [Leptospira borgpetersenii]MBE8365113.1 hypothetical protein [Leptospira borgpetersenii serovar Balcanica]MBE8367754.1 hypothetical protein [Leptospira borgpetersenii serovar Balcanica]MBE8401469.1 hypothetical protein [Leptospira borgpetersenii serovar Tarassovi]MBE8404440.1 hypothetical protein [Leptospira borgpetersenii serovar Tarassovi]MBE8407616.1 hypothetical protein [Leptospira borgpetersenii serovar Tarassovi]
MKHDHFGNIFLTILLDLDFFSRLQEEEIDLSELLELGIVFLEDFEKSGRCFLSIEREKISTSLLIRKSSYLQIFNYCFHSFRSFDSLMEEILHNVYLDFHLRLNQKPDSPFFDKYDVSYPENFLQHNNIIFEEKSSC